MEKRLYRSEENKVVGGVCGGLGEYFDIDPVLVRIIMVLLVLGTGVGILAYIVGWIIIPKREFEVAETKPAKTEFTAEEIEKMENRASWRSYWPGLILIVIGVIMLVHEHWYWLDFEELWPAAFIIIGLALIFGRNRSKATAESNDPMVNRTETNGGGAIS